ncbi:MAG TPA: hypothetical protein VGL53_11140 [Bryobacteraceae bacterium]
MTPMLQLPRRSLSIWNLRAAILKRPSVARHSRIWGPLPAQASVLSFKNTFFAMAIAGACLSPLPFIMRRPRPGEQKALGAH